MSSMVQVNRIYLIFNPVHFLVDSSEKTSFVMNASNTTTEMARKKEYAFRGIFLFERMKENVILLFFQID